jgi:hypothetical protein
MHQEHGKRQLREALRQPVADLIERPQFDPRTVQRIAQPVVQARVLTETVQEDNVAALGSGARQTF